MGPIPLCRSRSTTRLAIDKLELGGLSGCIGLSRSRGNFVAARSLGGLSQYRNGDISFSGVECQDWSFHESFLVPPPLPIHDQEGFCGIDNTLLSHDFLDFAGGYREEMETDE